MNTKISTYVGGNGINKFSVLNVGITPIRSEYSKFKNRYVWCRYRQVLKGSSEKRSIVVDAQILGTIKMSMAIFVPGWHYENKLVLWTNILAQLQFLTLNCEKRMTYFFGTLPFPFVEFHLQEDLCPISDEISVYAAANIFS